MNGDFWEHASLVSVDYLHSTPIVQIDTDPPPYAYRTEFKRPSRATYGDGTATTGPARHTGNLVADIYYDTSLTWQRSIFALNEPLTGSTMANAILKFNPTMEVNTDHRGSRPMLSYIVRCYLTDETGAANPPVTSPTEDIAVSGPGVGRGSISKYWRYVMPMTAAPFFHTTQQMKMTAQLSNIARIEDAASLSHAIVITAPRPMFGRGFNNNTTVETILSGTPEIWQIDRCAALRGSVRVQKFIMEWGGSIDWYENIEVSGANSVWSTMRGWLESQPDWLATSMPFHPTGETRIRRAGDVMHKEAYCTYDFNPPFWRTLFSIWKITPC